MIGLFILGMIVAGALLRRNLLFPAAMLAALFPASSVLNAAGSNSISVAPFWLVALLICGYCGFSFLLAGGRRKSALRPEVFTLLLTFYWAVAVSLIAPLLFKGLGVFSPRGGIDAQVGNLASLSFGISNIAQILYAIILMVFLVYASSSRREHLLWVKAALVIAASFGFYQFIADVYHLPFPTALVHNNQGIAIGNNQRIGDFLRINSTFAEPSTAGAFFAAGVLGMLAARSYVVAAVCFVGVLLSTSSTGYITLALALGTFLGYALFQELRKRRFPVVLASATTVLLLCGVTLISAAGLADIVLSSTVNKAGTVSFNNRTASDLYALDLTVQTFGLGVGLGSNRPSSFLTYVLSNTGIVGLLLLAASVALLLRNRGARWAKWGLMTYLLAKSLGVPDFNDPWLWIWFALALAVPAGAHRKNLQSKPAALSFPVFDRSKNENRPYFK